MDCRLRLQVLFFMKNRDMTAVKDNKAQQLFSVFHFNGVESEFQELLAHNKNCKKAVIFEICSSQGPFVTALIQQCNTMNGYDTCILCLSC